MRDDVVLLSTATLISFWTERRIEVVWLCCSIWIMCSTSTAWLQGKDDDGKREGIKRSKEEVRKEKEGEGVGMKSQICFKYS